MGEDINLTNMYKVIKKRIGMVISLGLLGILVSSILSFFVITPQYNSATQLLVSRSQSESVVQQSDINTNLLLINTYKDIIRGPVILDEVRESLELELTHTELANNIRVTSEENSQVFSIIVTDNNPYNAAIIANTIASYFQENIDNWMNVDNVGIISPAVPILEPTSPNILLNLIFGGFLGVLTGVLISLTLDMLDNTVKDEEFITRELEWINLGKVKEMSVDELRPNVENENVNYRSVSRTARY